MKKRTKRIFIILGIFATLGTIGYFGYNYLQERADFKRKQQVLEKYTMEEIVPVIQVGFYQFGFSELLCEDMEGIDLSNFSRKIRLENDKIIGAYRKKITKKERDDLEDAFFREMADYLYDEENGGKSKLAQYLGLSPTATWYAICYALSNTDKKFGVYFDNKNLNYEFYKKIQEKGELKQFNDKIIKFKSKKK